jgi:hypothetical protein
MATVTATVSPGVGAPFGKAARWGQGLLLTPPSKLKQRLEFFHAESGLFDDGTESAWFEVATRMDWHSNRSRPVAGEDHDVMTADDPICQES